MKEIDVFDTTPPKDDFEREEKCRRTLKAIGRAIGMRMAVVVLLILACLRAPSPWVVGIVALTAIISLAALPPLLKEWKLRRAELKEILDSEE